MSRRVSQHKDGSALQKASIKESLGTEVHMTNIGSGLRWSLEF